MKIYIYAALAIAFLIIAGKLLAITGADTAAVLNGEAQLWCDMPEGYRQIEPEKIKGYTADLGVWEFTNGHAKSCKAVFNDQP